MPKVLNPYKNSIWERDPRYDLDRAALGVEDFETICRLGAVDVAKKQVPPVPGSSLLEICKAIKRMPRASKVEVEHVREYLDQMLRHHGAGIATLICMLAVESGGDYPPMDRKFAAGLRKKGMIDEADERKLNGKASASFSKIYVENVIPAWLDSRTTRTPKDADNYWGRGGLDES